MNTNKVLGEGMMVKLSRSVLPGSKTCKIHGFKHGIAYVVERDETNDDLYVTSGNGDVAILVEGATEELTEWCEVFITVKQKDEALFASGNLSMVQ